jgi:hypothetical protein
LFWKHGKKMQARHAEEEEGILGLVDIGDGTVLGDMMDSAQMGATHIHRGLLSDGGGVPVDRSTWSSVYLQAGDAFLMSTGEVVHAAMKSSMQPCTGVLLQYQRVLRDTKS